MSRGPHPRNDAVRRGLLHLGNREFHPAGAAAVRVKFANASGAATLTVTDGDIVVTAARRS
jgi:hypothetical protein